MTHSIVIETELVSNISPQNPAFNRGYWAAFEKFVRSLRHSFDEVFVVTGPLYLPHLEENKFFVKYQVIGNPPNTSVPTHFYKGHGY
jgi:endonuclease G